MEASVLIGIVAIILTVVSSAAVVGARIGRLEGKVDALAERLNDESTARVRVLEAMAARLEALDLRFTEHAVQDASHFGEIKGILTQPAQR